MFKFTHFEGIIIIIKVLDILVVVKEVVDIFGCFLEHGFSALLYHGMLSFSILK